MSYHKSWPVLLVMLGLSFWLGRMTLAWAPPDTVPASPVLTTCQPIPASIGTTGDTDSSPAITIPDHRRMPPAIVSAPVTLPVLPTGRLAYQQLASLIEQAPLPQIDQQLQHFLSPSEMALLQDRRQFSQRLNDEFFGQRRAADQPVRAHATLRMGLDSQPPASAVTTLSLASPFQKIYAHILEVEGQSRSDLVFIKWQDLDSGQVLMFEKKSIIGARAENWISFVPAGGWQPHRYDVTLYSINDGMTVLAQQSYQVSLNPEVIATS